MRTRYKEAFEERSENVKILLGRDIRLFIIFLAGISNQIYYFMILLAILTNLNIIIRLLKRR